MRVSSRNVFPVCAVRPDTGIVRDAGAATWVASTRDDARFQHSKLEIATHNVVERQQEHLRRVVLAAADLLGLACWRGESHKPSTLQRDDWAKLHATHYTVLPLLQLAELVLDYISSASPPLFLTAFVIISGRLDHSLWGGAASCRVGPISWARAGAV